VLFSHYRKLAGCINISFLYPLCCFRITVYTAYTTISLAPLAFWASWGGRCCDGWLSLWGALCGSSSDRSDHTALDAERAVRKSRGARESGDPGPPCWTPAAYRGDPTRPASKPFPRWTLEAPRWWSLRDISSPGADDADFSCRNLNVSRLHPTLMLYFLHFSNISSIQNNMLSYFSLRLLFTLICQRYMIFQDSTKETRKILKTFICVFACLVAAQPLLIYRSCLLTWNDFFPSFTLNSIQE
jgi:hypothetical protein